MCGIYGVLNLSGAPATQAPLDAMGGLTTHRGPDDQGSYIDGPCAIGMRRLSIIDLAGGHQPIGNADGSLWVVCNGEIYNFRELRRELMDSGACFRTGSDTEVLVHAYAKYGDAFVQHLNGMFAFALWDARRARLLLGRDRLGIKPLYYINDGRQLAFASEAKALLALPGTSVNVDSAALEAYLALGYVPAPHSMFRGIKKLPVASMMIIAEGAVCIQKYWSIPAHADTRLNEADWADRIHARLAESVRMQMVSDVPIGAFLSGGIDSSAVLAFMSPHSDRPVRTYSIGFSGGAAENFYNELPYAKQVAQLFNTDHREIMVSPDVVGLLPKLLWHLDEPLADTAFLTTYLVAEFAHREVTVILSGVGGDELFGGYRRYLGDYYLEKLSMVPRPLRRAAAGLAARLPSDRHSPALNMVRYANGLLSSAELSFEERYRAYVGVFNATEIHALVSAPSPDRSDPLEQAFALATAGDALNRMLTVDSLTQLPDDLLMLTDKMTMASSLECRVPFLDHELVELAARIPAHIKVRGGELKRVLKRALRGVLPSSILQRKKRGFGAPMGAWLKTDLAAMLDHVLSERSVSSRGFFRYAPIASLIAAHRANRVDGTDRLLALLNFELWCRLFLDRRSAEDIAAELKLLGA